MEKRKISSSVLGKRRVDESDEKTENEEKKGHDEGSNTNRNARTPRKKQPEEEIREVFADARKKPDVKEKNKPAAKVNTKATPAKAILSEKEPADHEEDEVEATERRKVLTKRRKMEKTPKKMIPLQKSTTVSSNTNISIMDGEEGSGEESEESSDSDSSARGAFVIQSNVHPQCIITSRKASHRLRLFDPRAQPQSRFIITRQGMRYIMDSPVKQPVARPEPARKVTGVMDRAEQEKQHRLAEIDKEINMILDGTHPKVIDIRKNIKQEVENQEELINISIDRERSMICDMHDSFRATILKDREEKRNDLVGIMVNQIDDRIRTVDNELQHYDLGGQSAPQPAMSKKSLRKREKEPATSTIEKKKQTTKTTIPVINFLLTEAEIAADLKRIGNSAPTPTKMQQQHKVVLDGHKLVYEGKTFQRGQNLYVTSREWSHIPATILNFKEDECHFRSLIPGDTRILVCRKEELASGHITLSKRV